MPTAPQDVLLYQSPDGQIRLDVQLDHDTVWLTQAQMGELFGRDRSVITKHLRTIFQSGELPEKSNVQKTHIDVLISVGYRVNSVQGVRFRQWAAQVLRQYLVQGYALNKQRLRQSQRQLANKRLVQLQAEVAASQELTADQSDALLRVLGDYARALDVLDQYDHQHLHVAPGTVAPAATADFELTPDNARQATDALRAQFGGSELFGREKDQSFESSVRTIYKALAELTCTRAWKKRLPTCCILW